MSSTIRSDTGKRHVAKYANKNPIQRFVLARTFDAIGREIRSLAPARTLEFGSGEGLFLEQLKKRNLIIDNLVAIDIREDALESARALHPEYEFLNQDLLTWDRERRSFELVIASQVLEHLPQPGRFMQRLVELSAGHLLLTVPWEPWFRLMNLLRGRDIARLGNHPEHVNLWGLNAFRSFVGKYAEVERAYTVFPFIIAIARSPG